MSSINRNGSIAGGPAGRVLVVDDDRVTRLYFQRALERCGCRVTVATGARDAQQLCPTAGPFDCALIDYRMPDMDGIELLHWLTEYDPDLAAVVVTAEGEKELVEQALSGGACGFLDKPVKVENLKREVARAMEVSRHRRGLAQMAREVRAVARTQRAMVESPHGRASEGIRLSYHPCHDAGGDFLIRFRVSDEETLVLAADVSGHDIQAAFVGAYFQGLVRGMLNRSAPLAEILETFNQILLEEWSGGRLEAADAREGSSIALSALLIHSGDAALTVSVSGNPLPVMIDRDGRIQAVGRVCPALGWFPGPAVRPVCYRAEPSSSVRMWTDGLESLADHLGVDPLAVVYRLSLAQGRPEWLSHADDDILAAAVPMDSLGDSGGFEPLLWETRKKEEMAAVDQWQERWKRTLRFALPDVAADSEFDFLLAAREAFLNALGHGCNPGESATFAVSYDAAQSLLRLVVSDPGCGHGFKPAEHRDDTKPRAAHRGLEILEQMARRLTFHRNGAELWADLDAKRDSAPQLAGHIP